MRLLARLSLVLALWASVFVLVGHVASGAGASDFAGFNLGAKGTASQWTLDSPSLGVPASPTGELDIAHSEVTLKSGPVAYALGSIAWPGQVAANVPSFIQGEIEAQSGGQFEFPVNIPNYPVRAESFYPQGPATQGTQAGTVVMRSSARADGADASAHLNSFSFPAIATVGTESSITSTGFDQDGAVSLVQAAAKDISVLGGLLKFDAVTSVAAARSDGARGTVAGTTSVAGARVQEHRVTIDATGVHVEGQGIGTAAAQQSVNAVLKSAGVSVELARPVDTVAGAQATRALAGLIVRISDKTANQFVALLPPDLQAQIGGHFDQDVTVAFAPAVVSADAAKPFEFSTGGADTTVGGVTETARSTGDAGAAPTTDGGTTTLSSGTASPGSPSAGPTTLIASPAVKNFTGVPVPIVVLLVLLALVSSRPLMALADRMLFARRGASSCPEGR